MNGQIPKPDERKAMARMMFDAALAAADPAAAVKRAVRVDGKTISIADTAVSSEIEPRQIFAVAIGKAAFAMAAGLDQALGSSFQAGVAVGLADNDGPTRGQLSERWVTLTGDHPLPTDRSFFAGRAVVEFVKNADQPNATVVFLVSGGGSALAELCIDPRVTVSDLSALNSQLLSSGMPIRELNVVRRELSAIKGGGLAGFAPQALKIGLIVSDTNMGDERTVASGPTFSVPALDRTASDILHEHGLWDHAPPIIREILSNLKRGASSDGIALNVENRVLLSSDEAVSGGAKAAREMGYEVIIAPDIREQEISEGCREMVERLCSVDLTKPVCLLSAGEFRTPVVGSGRGGRSTETALRLALLLGETRPELSAFTALLAGTDGIDGNCPAAGAVIDETTLVRADSLSLDPQDYLRRSDSYGFFHELGDTIVTGPTGTNVRDLRILLGWA